jgi:hypothetical protein
MKELVRFEGLKVKSCWELGYSTIFEVGVKFAALIP